MCNGVQVGTNVFKRPGWHHVFNYICELTEKLSSHIVSYLLLEFEDELARALPLALGLEHALVIRQHTLSGFS